MIIKKTILLLIFIVFLSIGCINQTKSRPTLYTIKDSHGEIFYNMEILYNRDGSTTCKDIQNKKYVFQGNFTAIELKIAATEETHGHNQ